MKRIDPATVPDVFRRRNLKPAAAVFVGDAIGGECCILSALYCDTKGCEDPTACLVEIETMKTDGSPLSLGDRLAVAIGVSAEDELFEGPSYAQGVMNGWDSDDLDDEGFPDGDYADGIRDGIAARKAVAEAGMAVAVLSWDDDDDEDDLDFDDDEEE